MKTVPKTQLSETQPVEIVSTDTPKKIKIKKLRSKPTKRNKFNFRKTIVILTLLAVIVGGSYYAYLQVLKSTETVIQNAPGRQIPQNIPNSKTMHFDQPLFGFDAPADWTLVKQETAPYNRFSYKSTLKNADNRYLDIYVDGIPTNLAVNKAVAVRGQGTNLSHGFVSDNCTTFTAGEARKPGGTQALTYPAKWDGVEFLCDNDNVNRNVVGTSSPGSVNRVAMTGSDTVQHNLFFVYTDNNYTPEYTIFYHVLESFLLK